MSLMKTLKSSGLNIDPSGINIDPSGTPADIFAHSPKWLFILQP